MSVLIKGMQLPDMCGHCRFATAFDCQLTRNFIIDHKARNEDCQLIAVQDPHGRLIDADAFTQRINDESKEFYAMNEYGGGLRAGYLASIKAVKLAPTVIPASKEG